MVGQAVLRTWSRDTQRVPMLGGTVPLVVLESVRRVPRSELVQEPVTVDLRNDRSGRDRRAERVTMNNRKLRTPYARDRDGVQEDRVRLGPQVHDRDRHGLETRSQDVPMVYLLGAHDPDADGKRTAAKLGVQPLPADGINPLGIIQSRKHTAFREDYRRGHDRTRERAPTDFVHAGNQQIAAPTQLLLEAVELAKAAELGEQSAQGIGVHRWRGELFGSLFVNARGLSFAAAQIIKLGATHRALFLDFDRVNDWRMERENPLDADSA